MLLLIDDLGLLYLMLKWSELFLLNWPEEKLLSIVFWFSWGGIGGGGGIGRPHSLMSSDVAEIFFETFSLCRVCEPVRECFDFLRALFLCLRDLFKSLFELIIWDCRSSLRWYLIDPLLGLRGLRTTSSLGGAGLTLMIELEVVTRVSSARGWPALELDLDVTWAWSSRCFILSTRGLPSLALLMVLLYWAIFSWGNSCLMNTGSLLLRREGGLNFLFDLQM